MLERCVYLLLALGHVPQAFASRAQQLLPEESRARAAVRRATAKDGNGRMCRARPRRQSQPPVRLWTSSPLSAYWEVSRVASRCAELPHRRLLLTQKGRV
eukprot:6966511-Pyramimonas_sp.AAC.1